MNHTFESCAKLATSRLTGASYPMVLDEFAYVIDDFCRRSTVWREMIYAADITATDREITLTHGPGTGQIAGILRVYYNETRLVDYSHAPFEVETAGYFGYTTRGNDAATIVLTTIPTQSETGVIDAYVYLTPYNSGYGTPSVVINNYFEYLLDGLLARMYAHQNRPYTNDAMALAHMRKYTHGIYTARASAERGFTSNAQNWVYPSFGR